MIRHLEIEHPIAYATPVSGSSALALLIGRSALGRFLIELCLLREGLTERLVLTDRNRRLSVAAGAVSKLGRFKSSEDDFAVSLSAVQLELVCTFLLKYYRDGEAEVDHIDVELDSDEGCGVALVIKAENAKKPIGGSEAKRLLGLG
jgi:hypothetical protein